MKILSIPNLNVLFALYVVYCIYGFYIVTDVPENERFQIILSSSIYTRVAKNMTQYFITEKIMICRECLKTKPFRWMLIVLNELMYN